MAVKRDILSAPPWRVSMLKVQKRPRAILPGDVARAWFGTVDDAAKRAPAIGAAMRLMFGPGLRESETTSARWDGSTGSARPIRQAS